MSPVHTDPSYFFKIHINTALLPISASSYRPLSFWISHLYLVRIFLVSCMLHALSIPFSNPLFLVVSFLLAFPPKSYMRSSSPHSCYIPAHLILLDLIILITLGEECELWNSSLCSFLQPPITSSFLGPNILLSTLFNNTLSLCSSLNVRDQVSHPHKTTGKIMILHFLIFMYFEEHQYSIKIKWKLRMEEYRDRKRGKNYENATVNKSLPE
jgi:hypothetical protein